jgi:1,4-alpha-glucan branching enzyme
VLSKNETISLGEIERLVAGQHHDPHSVLGAHPLPGDNMTIRALRPLATSVTAVLPGGSRHPMRHLHLGVFEAAVPWPAGSVPDYRLEVGYANGEPQLQDDPYRYLPTHGVRRLGTERARRPARR